MSMRMSTRSLGHCYLGGPNLKSLSLSTWHEHSTGHVLADARTPRHVKDLPTNLVFYHSPTPALDAAEQPFLS